MGLDVYSAVRVIGDAGAEYIELWGEVPHAYPDLVDRQKLRDTVSSYNMVVTTHAPFTDLNVASPFQPVRGSVEKTLEAFVSFSDFLGAKMATFHPGSVHNASLAPRALKEAAAVLSKIVEASGGRLSINLENQTKSSSKYYYPVAPTVESLGQLLEAVPGSRCTLDVGHAYASGIDPSDFLGMLGGRLAEVHLSDNEGKSDDHLIPGRGSAPLDRFMEGMGGGDVLVCLELNPYRHSGEEILAALKATRTRKAWSRL